MFLVGEGVDESLQWSLIASLDIFVATRFHVTYIQFLV